MNHTEQPSHYIHGYSSDEEHRLSLLNDVLNEASLRELGLQGGERILDVGSGPGQFTRAMARAAGRKGRVIGIERDAQQLAGASRLARDAGEENLVEFRQGDARNLPLRRDEWGAFDVAHARFLLEHVPDPAAVVSEMARALRPGGRVVVSDDDHESFRPWPEPAGFHRLWEAYLRSYDRLGNDAYIGRRLVLLLYDAGLRNIRNSGVFFGGCAGTPAFHAVADNLIGTLVGARELILSGGLLDETAYTAGMEGLNQWKAHPAGALWYATCWAEGSVEETG